MAEGLAILDKALDVADTYVTAWGHTEAVNAVVPAPGRHRSAVLAVAAAGLADTGPVTFVVDDGR